MRKVVVPGVWPLISFGGIGQRNVLFRQGNNGTAGKNGLPKN